MRLLFHQLEGRHPSIWVVVVYVVPSIAIWFTGEATLGIGSIKVVIVVSRQRDTNYIALPLFNWV
jgi:hypothetical protein